MKLILFWIFTPVFFISGVLLSNFTRSGVSIVFTILLISTMFPDFSDINFVSREEYRAVMRGFSVHLVDICILILLVVLLLKYPLGKLTLFPPLSLFLLSYILMNILSTIFTPESIIRNPYPEGEIQLFETWLYPLFELNRLIKGFILFWVAFQYMKFENYRDLLVKVTIVIILVLTVKSLYIRYILGENRVSVFSHVNTYNTYLAFCGCLIMPWVYQKINLRTKFFYAFLLACLFVSILLTISRSALFGIALAFIVITFLSVLRIRSYLNFVFVLSICAILFLTFVKASDTLYERFFVMESTEASYEGREKVYSIAKEMGFYSLFGVGPGNFSAYSITKYETSKEPVGTLAHNIFYLVFAEVGFPGLIAFIALLMRIAQIILSNIFRTYFYTRTTDYLLSVGILGSFMTLMIQNLLHFSFRFPTIYDYFLIVCAAASAIYFQQKGSSPISLKLKNLR